MILLLVANINFIKMRDSESNIGQQTDCRGDRSETFFRYRFLNNSESFKFYGADTVGNAGEYAPNLISPFGLNRNVVNYLLR